MNQYKKFEADREFALSKDFVKKAEELVAKLAQELGWSFSDLQTENMASHSDFVQCPYDSKHCFPAQFLTKHMIKCKPSEIVEEKLSSFNHFYSEAPNVVKIQTSFNVRGSSCEEHDRQIMEAQTVRRGRGSYLHTLPDAKIPTCTAEGHRVEGKAGGLEREASESRGRTRQLEIQERDLKRRRQSYTGKKTKGSARQIMREYIDSRMSDLQ
mmetsp:Transcript_27428/g.37845  ORF Transcript_27428/g.37845 Transcript_27428/m.37845 type:complete len:212 (-) Transcript_27428:266-901(-)|eukprot:CAMPEP_0196571986 /NCGR_PEP_ID=MMETSP1081-20130531/2109_1 /TAXON_ID=36882 /ORGANISM="Pyramimonas amylifera, Strain CCMP720" /LENGTH=211 /DNA_ID=CAMNT_0041889137 /DNA_START=41 /DNA_END=676 /DNA_ORIENTATION=-